MDIEVLKPPLALFGLPAKTSFLWIVANILGLAYGAAVMIEEINAGKVENAKLIQVQYSYQHLSQQF